MDKVWHYYFLLASDKHLHFYLRIQQKVVYHSRTDLVRRHPPHHRMRLEGCFATRTYHHLLFGNPVYHFLKQCYLPHKLCHTAHGYVKQYLNYQPWLDVSITSRPEHSRVHPPLYVSFYYRTHHYTL